MNNCCVKTLELENFRNIENAFLEFSPGINVITGENGQGKTNLIESIWLLTGAKSFRGSKDKDMIKKGEEFSRIISVLEAEGDYENKIELLVADTENKKGRFAKFNGGTQHRAVSLAGKFYSVVFCPQHLTLVSGSPSLRRKFIDGALCQIYPGYIKTFKTFEKLLMQKNSLLKDRNSYRFEFSETLDIYNRQIAVYGNEIYLKRKEYIDLLSVKAKEYYSKISGGREEIDFKYLSFCQTGSEDMYKLLQSALGDDMRAGFSTCGVQREDIEVVINGAAAKDFASQGQQRSIVLAMKLAESDILQEKCGVNPVILLDDVLSELDWGRQEYLLNNIEGKQVFISSCDENRINLAQSKKYLVRDGKIECI